MAKKKKQEIKGEAKIIKPETALNNPDVFKALMDFQYGQGETYQKAEAFLFSNQVHSLTLQSLKIGLDFDGVIADNGKLKSLAAKVLYSCEIPIHKFRRDILLRENMLTLEQYEYLRDQIYSKPHLGLRMEPVEGVLEYLPKLQQEGFTPKVITSRNQQQWEIALQWMSNLGIEIEAVPLGEGVSKVQACRGLDVYIDDDLNKLESLQGVVPHRFLFSHPYNEDLETGTIATRIHSWKSFYEEIQKIAEEI